MNDHPSSLPDDSVPSVDPRSRLRQKVVLWTLAGVIFLFWDNLLHLLLELLHIILEYAELGTESLLMALFPLDEHDGQMVTAWIGLAAFTGLLAWAYLSISKKIRNTFRSWAYFRSWLKVYCQDHWVSMALMAGLYLAYVVLF